MTAPTRNTPPAPYALLRRICAGLTTAAALAFAGVASAAGAEEAVLNLYSARHYQTDEALYANFTRATGIRINRIEATDEQLLERLRGEGAASPADVVLIVDAARLWQAQQSGLFQPVRSATLAERIPVAFRDPDGHWFGFSYRARALVYRKGSVDPAAIATYESLADPANKGKVCARSGAHPYNLSLIAAVIAHDGAARAEAWAKGVVANMARSPRGGDTDQIKAVAAGECGVALVNTYYYARIVRSDKPEDREIAARVGLVLPDQKTHGTHVNIAGGGIAKSAPHPGNAARFLEYLASDDAQAFFADGNNEWPVVRTVAVRNPALAALGSFRIDDLPVTALGRNVAEAQRLADRAGWK